MHCRTLAASVVPPTAGNNLTVTFSDSEYVKVRSLRVALTTGATVAERFLLVYIEDPTGVVIFQNGRESAVAASRKTQLVCSPTFSTPVPIVGAAGSATGLGLPDMWLPPGWRIFVEVEHLQATDVFTSVTYAADFADSEWVRASRLLIEQAEISHLAGTLSA